MKTTLQRILQIIDNGLNSNSFNDKHRSLANAKLELTELLRELKDEH